MKFLQFVLIHIAMEPKKRVYKVVLTGGPCGGKTTGQSRLCTFFENLGWKVFRVPETATVLLSGGIKFSDLTATEDSEEASAAESVPSLDRSEQQTAVNLHPHDSHACPHCMAAVALCVERPSEAFKFQENLLRTMVQMENTFFELGDSCTRNCLIICDRGAMDASAFIDKEKWETLMRNNGWNAVELRDNRYNQIIHMVSAAKGAEDFYTIEDHACRSEGVELARELDDNAAAAWIGHPYFDVIDNSTDFESKICRMIECVCQKLSIDTGDRLLINSRKRKFLVRSPLPPDEVFPSFQDFDVVHHYLQTSTPHMQARLRKRGQNGHWSYIHTIRRPMVRGQVIEVKTQLTHRDYQNLQAQVDESHFTIHKLRRCFLVNSQYFQLDVYREPCHQRCKGLIFLETYTALDDVGIRKVLPSFLDVVEEVTGNPNFSMFNLSLKEDWNNSKRFCHTMQGFGESIKIFYA
ncbi:hypothetical protein B566_EDAN011393 [Ephemera danica]|nr:hypothetical protein B566_EDAN011393 [Ephemera danica]